MSTYVSPFNGLPTQKQMRELAFPGAVPFMPFQHEGANQISSYEKQYLDAVLRCITEGHVKSSRPGQNTLMLDDVQFVIDISGGQIPLLSTKFVPYKSFVVENLWFISGSTDVAFLKENNVPIWDEWVIPETAKFEPADKYVAGEMLNWVRCIVGADAYKSWRKFQSSLNIGRPSVDQVQTWWGTYHHEDFQDIPMVKLVSGSIGEGAYGTQWRKRDHTQIVAHRDASAFRVKNPDYRGDLHDDGDVAFNKVYDQLGDVIKMLRETPDSRRIILDAWNPGMIKDCALPPCHPWVQFTSHMNQETGKRELTVKLTQRSSDAMLGVPFNVGQYGLLAHMVAHITNHNATKLVWSTGDFHIYEDQLPMVAEQLTRQPRPVGAYVSFNPDVKEIDDFKLNDIIIEGYQKHDAHPMINYPVAV